MARGRFYTNRMDPTRLRRFNWRIVAARLLIVAGLAMIGYFYGTGLFTYYTQNQLRRQWDAGSVKNSARPANSTDGDAQSPAPDPPAGDIFGRLVVSKLNLDVIVLEGTDRATLTRGPGHIRATAAPHEGRNTAISGHRTTFGAPFAQLDDLESGDVIELTTKTGEYRYRVTGRAVVRPTDVSVIGQGFKNRLTLTTCDPPGSAVKRLAVWAVLDEP